MSNVQITSVKKKKRVRSIFSDNQIEKRGDGSSDSEEGKGMLKPQDQESQPLPDTTYRFEVDLQALTKGDKYPQIYFSDLVTAQEEAEKSPEHGEEDSEMARLAAHFESKYGEKKKRVTDIQLDHGYDTSDPFVDDSEAFDEVIPDELDTQFGGFYINFGDLMFKKVEPVISDNEDQESESKTKKRKRDDEEDHDKQRHDEKKIKKAKIKSLKNRLKEMHKKPKVHRVIDDDSDDSDSDTAAQSADHSQPTSCSVSDLETTNKDKSKEKESNDLTKEKVLKKSIKDKKEIKVPQLIEEFKKIVSDNGPFDRSKLHLLHSNLYSLEVEVRVNRKKTMGKKILYETLSAHVPGIDQKELRNLGNTSFLKQCKVNQEKKELPMRAAIDVVMPAHISNYAKAKTEYDNTIAALPPDDNDELVKPKAPLRTFVWTDEIRTLYGAVVRTKLESIKLYREKITEQEEFMRSYLDKLAENFWPVGWMSTDALVKEATPYCTFYKNPKKGINKAPSVKTIPKTKPFKPDNKSKISSASKLLKNAITKQAAKQDQLTKKITLQAVTTPVAQSKPSIIKQYSTPDPAIKFLPHTGVQTSPNLSLKAPVNKTPNPNTSKPSQQQLTNKLSNFVDTKSNLNTVTPLATKPNNISRIITAPPSNKPKVKLLSLKKSSDIPKTTTNIVNNKITASSTIVNNKTSASSTIVNNKTSASSTIVNNKTSASSTIVNNKTSASSTIVNNKLQPVLQLSQAKPQPSSKKLDNSSTEMSQPLRNLRQTVKDHFPEMYTILQGLPQEQADVYLKDENMIKMIIQKMEQNKLNVSTARTATVSKGGTSSSTPTSFNSPILIDDDNTPPPARTVIGQKQTPSPKPSPLVQKAAPIPFPQITKTTPSPKQTPSPKPTPSVSRITPVSVKPALVRTTPPTSKPLGSLLQKAALKSVNSSKSFNIQNIISNNLSNNNKLPTVVSRPNNTFPGLNNTITAPALASRPLSNILSEHSEKNSTGVPLKPLKSLTESLNKLNYKTDKTL